jgi:hypothetical protein
VSINRLSSILVPVYRTISPTVSKLVRYTPPVTECHLLPPRNNRSPTKAKASKHIPSYHSSTATHLSFPLPRPKSIIPPLSPAALTEWQTPHGGCVHSTHITLHTRSLSILKKTWHLQLPYRIPTLAPGRSPQI